MPPRPVLLSFGIAFAAQYASAAITVTNLWSLGEDGQILATDSIAAKNFTSKNPGTIAVDSTNFSGIGGSTKSLAFTGAFEYGPTITIPTNNWVVELSIYVSSVPGSDITFLTLGSTNGSQMGVHGGKYFFGQQNVSYGFNTQAVTAGVWQNLAWVNDSGNSSFYLNGSLIGTSTTNFGFGPANDNGSMTLATASGGSSTFTGNLDNLRFSTFTAGQFNASTDLLVSAVPEPSTYGLPGVGAFAFAFAFVRRRRKSAR